MRGDEPAVDLNPTYVEMATERIVDDCPLFADRPAEPPEDERMADLFSYAAD